MSAPARQPCLSTGRRACPTAGGRAHSLTGLPVRQTGTVLSRIFVWLRSVFLTATLKNDFHTVITVLSSLPYLSFWKASENSRESCLKVLDIAKILGVRPMNIFVSFNYCILQSNCLSEISLIFSRENPLDL